MRENLHADRSRNFLYKRVFSLERREKKTSRKEGIKIGEEEEANTNVRTTGEAWWKKRYKLFCPEGWARERWSVTREWQNMRDSKTKRQGEQVKRKRLKNEKEQRPAADESAKCGTVGHAGLFVVHRENHSFGTLLVTPFGRNNWC